MRGVTVPHPNPTAGRKGSENVVSEEELFRWLIGWKIGSRDWVNEVNAVLPNNCDEWRLQTARHLLHLRKAG